MLLTACNGLKPHPEYSGWRQGDYKQLKTRRLNEYLKYLLPRALARG